MMKRIIRKVKDRSVRVYNDLTETKKVGKVVDKVVKVKKIQEELSIKRRKINNDLELFKIYAVGVTTPIALVFNVAVWKRNLVRNYLNEYRVIFIGLNHDLEKYEALLQIPFLDTVIIIWGRSIPLNVRFFSESNDIPVYYLEDGFVRSVGLGSEHMPPLSLCLDKRGLYYDSNEESDLEYILNNFDFSSNSQLVNDAHRAINFIVSNAISKYNLPDTNYAKNVYGPKNRKRVLVIGQVEDDQSILYGCNRPINNYELLKLVINENPEAQVIYKIHPDILAGKRKELSDISDLMDNIEVININMSLNDALYEVDHVYTITSLAGFESLMYGVRVTTIGAPFYSGWGLTDDRQPCTRRTRKLSIEEVFAAAYILYPRYRTADSYSSSDIFETLRYIQSMREKGNITKEVAFIEKIKFYNFETKFPAHYKQILNSRADKVAVLSDSINSLELAESIVENSISEVQVDLITSRDSLANDEELVNSSVIQDENKQVHITSIHKKYSVPLSRLESESVELSVKISESLQSVLEDLFGSFIDQSIIQHLSIGLSDYCYFEVLRFLGAKEVFNEYDMVLLYFEEIVKHKDILQSAYYHANQNLKLNKVFLSVKGTDVKPLLRGDFALTKIVDEQEVVFQTLSENKKIASSFWYDINQSIEKYENDIIFVCGNIVNQNYAYSPSTKKIIETVSNNFYGDIVFINSGLTNKKANNDFKRTFLDTNLYKKVNVYEGSHNSFIDKYGDKYLKYEYLFINEIPNQMMKRLNGSIPVELLEVVESRIISYCKRLQELVVLAIEVYSMKNNIRALYTSMERSITSRIITEICKQDSINTIGIQPQIISVSPRYFKPIVDKMGVIDTGQSKVLKEMGYEDSKIHPIGSINIIDRLEMLEEHDNKELQYEIFFAMQHSVYELMMPALEAIKEIVKHNNYKVIIKPHPHQELPVYYKVRKMFSGMPSVKVLSRESDTYSWLGRSKIVVGMFSSVLFESAIYGKDVIVTSFKEIDDSINMANQGIALEVKTQENFDILIKDLLEKGEHWIKLQEMKRAYLDKHSYFKPPYSSNAMEQFIVDNLPKQSNKDI